MQEVEMFLRIKMWLKGLTGKSGYMDSSDLWRICALMFWLSCDSPGLSADCRIDRASCLALKWSFQPQFYQVSCT
jgi:hypothetical protein